MVRGLLEEDYRRVERIRLVCDNLSSHSPAAFYESFPPEVARSLTKRIEFVYTPVHGSWLNMVEIELSVLWFGNASEDGLPDVQTLGREAQAWCGDAIGSEGGRLAFHHGGCSHQAPQPLPFRESVTEY
jgi:hypothetical protein